MDYYMRIYTNKSSTVKMHRSSSHNLTSISDFGAVHNVIQDVRYANYLLIFQSQT